MPRLTKLASLAVKALEDLKALEITVLDVSRHTTVTDWWIICTGTSNRHVKSLAENVVLKAKAADERPRSVQGLERSEWVLVDLGSVVVHVLQLQARAHYQLEKLIPESAPVKAAPAPRRAAKPGPAVGGKGKKPVARRAGTAASKKKPGKPRRK